jgi:hypothetical protein
MSIAATAFLLFASNLLLPAMEWYDNLRPGITRAEVQKMGGAPSRSDAKTDDFVQAKGHIKCIYENDVLRSAIYYGGQDGAVSDTLYMVDGTTSEVDKSHLKAFLDAGKFRVIPSLAGRKVYTHKYDGVCYELDGGFVVIEPIIQLMGANGFFADKAARVLWLKPDQTETVLYRASDHWNDLKPPGLTQSEVESRSSKLTKAGNQLFKLKVVDVLGQSDSSMGSGIDYQLFYLDDALAIVTLDFSSGKVASICFLKPGSSTLTLQDWLRETR